MSVFLTILQLLPAILALVRQVETLVAGAKQGQVKRDVAVGVLNGTIDAARSAGLLRPADAERAQALTGPLVDLTVGVLNATGVLQRSDEPQAP